jgi:peptidyl-prolyl cis-trans isomerase D
MLQTIRDRFTGGFALGILALIAVPFAFFGITDYNFLTSGSAAKVGDQEISILQLENAYQNQLLQMSDYGDLPPEYRQLIREGVLQSLIRDTLVEQYVIDEGFRIDDSLVAEVIENASQFQEDGVFKKELYYTWLDQTAQDVRAFEAQQRQSIRVGQLQRGIGATAFVTPSEYRRYLNLFAEQRQFSMATFDVAALADTVVIRDEDVVAYYEAHPTEFMSPESVDFNYLELSRESLAAQATISEEQLQQHYQDSVDRFQQDEQRRASHILILAGDDEAAALELATSLAARAKAGEPFADIARSNSMDTGTAEQGGDLGAVFQSQMPGALGDTIFAMSKGQIQGPVKTDFGYHVVQLNDVIPGGPLPLDQVRGELEEELRDRAAEDEYRALERRISDALFDAADLQAIADATGLPLRSATDFTRDGGEPFGANQTVIDTVFDLRTLNDGQISDVVEIDADRAIVVKVSTYHEEARKPLEDVRDEIIFSQQSERALNMIQDRSRRLYEALDQGQDFAEVATDLEASYTPPATTDRSNPEIDRALLDAIFRVKKPSSDKASIGDVVTDAGDYVVFVVNAVIPGRPETIPLADRDARKDELQRVAGQADFGAFVGELERRADVVISDDALAQPDFL